MHFKSLPSNWSSVVRSVHCVKLYLVSECSERNLKTSKIFSKILKIYVYMSHSQMLGNVESGGGPIFKVVLEC